MIERPTIASVKSGRHAGKTVALSGFSDKVKMIVHHTERVDLPLGLFTRFTQCPQKSLPIIVVN